MVTSLCAKPARNSWLAQAAGFAVHYQRGKRAFEPRWSTSPPKIAEELRRDYRDGYNIGFRTGDWSKLDGWPIVVLDADIRSDDPAHREAAREAWRELVGHMKPTVRTGGGGAHLYLRCPPDELLSEQSIVLRQSPDKVGDKPAWTIELLSGGHAVTLPPSIHPSGQPYEWMNGGLAHVEAMPEALLHVVAAIRQSRPAGTAEADGAWPESKPIIAELKPVPAFDAETLLPDVLRAWIMDEAERMPCPPDFIAAAALVALGSIIGARCAIKPKGRDSWLIVPNLWGGIPRISFPNLARTVSPHRARALCFPGARSNGRPMSDNAIPAAMRRMGVGKDEMSGHGFRAVARTILDEVLGVRPDYIEHQLAHAVRDPNGRAYNRTAHLPERRKMMQQWTDYLDKLKAGAEVIPLHGHMA